MTMSGVWISADVQQVASLVLENLHPGKRLIGSGGGAGGVGIGGIFHTVHVPGAEDALQGPQHDHNEQNHEHEEERHPLPVGESAHHAHSSGPGLGGWVRRLAGANVNAYAEGHGAVGVPRDGVLPGALVAQLLPVQPHRLHLLLVAGEFAEDLVAGGQGGGALVRQCGRVSAERAVEAGASLTAFLVDHRDRHEAGETLEAEGVGALQHLGGFEDIVVGVVADGALRLARHRHFLLRLCGDILGAKRSVPDL